MKKWILILCGCLGLSLAFTSCEAKLDIQKCEDLILSHPFFKCRHVGITDKNYPDCKDALVGSRANAYMKLSGPNTTAYYYDLYGFGINNIHDLVIEGKRATCKFDMAEVAPSVADKYFKIHRIRGKKMACEALFVNYEGTGWKLERIVPEERLFMINIWDNGAYKTMINFDSFN